MKIIATLLAFVFASMGVRGQNITDVRQALDFLYAYMPLPDSVDYDRQFWEKNISSSLQARREMPWGKTVPEREFRHFVLPVRVNNENLDLSRPLFFADLKDRIGGMSMEEAVLEVNHWCHERVTYTPSDERTSSPLATIRTAYGRCGEESTLLVAALRAVCIPARQVYTPRWAHTDDNHAWVEAWVDGRWRFLGACEPEPVLDLGWFNAPASRSMLMHTKAFGNYEGPELVIERTPCYTEIAVTETYAPTRQRQVLIVDEQGEAVPDAIVEYKIYNYAEFYTFATKRTDERGCATIEAGLGDLIVWAHKEGRYGFARHRMTEEGTQKIVLEHRSGDAYALDMDIVPPQERHTIPYVSEEQRKRNNERMAEEDAMRQGYEQSFISERAASELAQEFRLDEQRLCALLKASRGNWRTLVNFIKDYPSEEAVTLLETLSQKDLRDVELCVLRDNMTQAPARQGGLSDSIYFHYVRCPRVANERLTPYRSFFLSTVPTSCQREFRRGGIPAIIDWTKENLNTQTQRNPQSLRMLPTGVWNHRLTDERSRDIFFVSLCRTFGFPARMDAVTGKVQYMDADGEAWHDVSFEPGTGEKDLASPKGQLALDWQALDWNNDPKYYTHFTLSRIDEEGAAHLLSYPEDGKWSTTLAQPQTMDAGDYLLTSGTRMADGSVLVHLEVQALRGGESLRMPLRMREPEEGLQVIGSLNSESAYRPLKAEELGQPRQEEAPAQSILSTTGRGYYILGFITPNNEPTNHTLRDICAAREALEAWGGHLVLLFADRADAERFGNLADFRHLPLNTHFGWDATGKIYEELQRELRLKGSAPVFVIADSFNRVVFVSEGYTIGLGERLARYLSK